MWKLIKLTGLSLILVILFLADVWAATSDASGLVRAAAAKHGVPASFALKVGRQESGNRCGLRGRHGEVGPLQILPATARGLGYKSIRSASCATQVDAGMKHLAKCYRGMKGDMWKAAACHNAGLGTIKSQRFPAYSRKYATAVVGGKSVPARKRSRVVVQPANDLGKPETLEELYGRWTAYLDSFPAPKKERPRVLKSCNWAKCPN
jgi:soluble lytic murein transglycosylase-like protein